MHALPRMILSCELQLEFNRGTLCGRMEGRTVQTGGPTFSLDAQTLSTTDAIISLANCGRSKKTKQKHTKHQ